MSLNLVPVGDDGTLVDDLRGTVVAFMRNVAPGVAEEIRGAFGRNFGREGRPARWQALHPRTQRERRAQGYGPTSPILVRTGGYKDSWVNATEVVSINEDRLTVTIEVGSDDPRVEKHEVGGSTPVGTFIPARPVAVLTDYDKRKLRDRFNREAEGAL